MRIIWVMGFGRCGLTEADEGQMIPFRVQGLLLRNIRSGVSYILPRSNLQKKLHIVQRVLKTQNTLPNHQTQINAAQARWRANPRASESSVHILASFPRDPDC